jgi:hypothetical protein
MGAKRRIRLVAWALVIAVTVIGCTRASGLGDEAPDVQITLDTSPDPPVFGRPCQMVIRVIGGDGRPVDDAQLQIKGDMTHAGMVPVVVTLTDGTNGAYEAAFGWTMAGDWIVTVEATLPDGRVARRQFEVGVGAPGG